MAGQTSHCLDVDGLGTVRRASCRRSYVDAMVTWGTPLGCCRALMTRAPKGYPSRRFPRHELPLGEAVGPTIRNRSAGSLSLHSPNCLILLSQTESPRRSFTTGDSAH